MDAVSTGPDSMTENTYVLRCVDCSFETTVDGDPHDALEVADSHHEEHGETVTDHFVNLELTG